MITALSLAVDRAEEQKGIDICKLPSSKDDAHKEWRKNLLNKITKTREMDQDFRERITNDRVYTCEKHFEAEDIEICKLCLIFVFTSKLILNNSVVLRYVLDLLTYKFGCDGYFC